MKSTLLKVALGLGLLSIANGQTNLPLSGGFSSTASNQAGGNANVRSAVNAGISNTNRAMGASRSNTRIQTGWFAIFPNYNDSNKDVGSALGDWRRRRSVIGRTGAGETQLRLQDRTRADFMMFIIRRNARGNNGEATPDTGFSCIKGNRERQPSFPHELGHNLSALHSHANTMRRTSNNDLPRDLTTLVGSRGRAYAASGGPIINLFSNPNTNYRRARTGTNSKKNALRMSNARVSRSRIR